MNNKNWATPPIVFAAFKLQQMRARIEQILLHEKLQRAQAMLDTQTRKIKAPKNGR